MDSEGNYLLKTSIYYVELNEIYKKFVVNLCTHENLKIQSIYICFKSYGMSVSLNLSLLYDSQKTESCLFWLKH